MTESGKQSFGKYLRTERLLREVTIDEIAEATKIKSEYLRALETNQFDKIPNQTFLKGYIRAYSRYCGLNEDEVLINFEFFDQQADQEKQSQLAKGTESDVTRKRETGVLRKRWILYILLFILAVTLSYFFAHLTKTIPLPGP